MCRDLHKEVQGIGELTDTLEMHRVLEQLPRSSVIESGRVLLSISSRVIIENPASEIHDLNKMGHSSL